jgi:transcriptional regulator with XRE-family HTH domain
MPLYDRRRAKSMTQKDVAQALGVSIRTVSAWETRERVASAPHRRALAELLGGHPSEYDHGDAPADPALIEAARAVLAEARENYDKYASHEGLLFQRFARRGVRCWEDYLTDPEHPDLGAFAALRAWMAEAEAFHLEDKGFDPVAEHRKRERALIDRILRRV